MATTKKTVKVRDLKPTKDAKGGNHRHAPNSGGPKAPNKHRGHSANN
jgi:hypothetical protein